jgi:hypothetical protein
MKSSGVMVRVWVGRCARIVAVQARHMGCDIN